jgi:hypothetical protein
MYLKYPQWQQPFQDAVLSFQNGRYLKKLDEAEATMVKRLRLLILANSEPDEQRALVDSLSALKILKKS